MDISSIIDPDTATTAPAHPVRQSLETRQGLQLSHTFHNSYPAQSLAHDGSRETRPPQRPPLQPLQPPSYNNSSSPSTSSYNSVQSPFQQTPSSALSAGQYPFPQHPNQSPAHGFPPPSYAHRESHIASAGSGHQPYSASAPLALAPLSINSSGAHTYSHTSRQPVSHSISTPTSAQNQFSTLSKESPQGSQFQTQGQPQSHPSHQYISQPGTPLGPPTFSRNVSGVRRESPGSFEHQRSHSGGSHGYQQTIGSSPRTEVPGSSTASPSTYEPKRFLANHPGVLSNRDRDRSLSVSPKTRLPNQPQTKPLHVLPDDVLSWNAQTIPSKRKFASETQTSSQLSPLELSEEVHNGIESSKPFKNHSPLSRQLHRVGSTETRISYERDTSTAQLKPDHNAESSPTTKQLLISHSTSSHQAVSISPQQPSNPSDRQPSPLSHRSSPSGNQRPSSSSLLLPHPSTHPQLSSLSPHQSLSPSRHAPSSVSSQAPASLPTAIQNSATVGNPYAHIAMPHASSFNKETQNEGSVAPPIKSHPTQKRRRPKEVPRFAQSIRDIKNHFIPTAAKQTQPIRNESGKAFNIHTQIPPQILPQIPPQPKILPMARKDVKHEANGHTVPNNINPIMRTEPPSTVHGPLGPWEPTIVNVIPSEEIIRVISDFLFAEVVSRDDVGSGPAGGGTSKGAMLEIEAKLGKLIDRNTNERLNLPVLTECVLSSHDPHIRTAFKSSMTEAQHRSLNEFLNKALVSSQAPQPSSAAPHPAARARAPMSYVHTFECDSFFDLSQLGSLSLPGSIRAQLNPRNTNGKVRVTTDQKTGQEIARIVKVRVADIDIYSPRTPFDWRISVNLEMNFDGDLQSMTTPSSGQGKRADRNKDRVSYKHQAYQIDLTQVTPAEAVSQAEKEHELEIEVSTHEIRKQGLLARSGQPNDYEKLIRGFVDNVRLLARHCT